MDYAQYNRITYAVADPEIWDGAGRECREWDVGSVVWRGGIALSEENFFFYAKSAFSCKIFTGFKMHSVNGGGWPPPLTPPYTSRFLTRIVGLLPLYLLSLVNISHYFIVLLIIVCVGFCSACYANNLHRYDATPLCGYCTMSQ